MGVEVGEVIDGKYRIVRPIGRGGMGSVFEGENVRIRRRVAIKVLHANVAENQELVTRFEREAQAAGCIGSDHILEVIDLGYLASGERYMVMEYLDGEPLSDRIRRHGRLTPAQALPLMRQVLEGLGAAHNAGIIHRDLKPDNIFILREKASRPDFVKIIDFGISKFSQAGDTLNVTRAGAMMGTPLYMSPEQAKGGAQADARSDIYALGVILYEALSGAVPFHAQTFSELLFEIVLAEIPPIEAKVPDVHPAVADLVRRAMNRDPVQRFQSASEFLAAIDHTLAQLGLPVLGSSQPGLAMQTGGYQIVQPGPAPAAQLSASQPGLPGGPDKPLNATTGATSFSADGDAGPPKKGKGLVAVALVLGLVVVGGGVVIGVKVMGDNKASAKTESAEKKDDDKGDKDKADKDKADKDKADKGDKDKGDKDKGDKDKGEPEDLNKGGGDPSASASAKPSASTAPTTTGPVATVTPPATTGVPTAVVTGAPTGTGKKPPPVASGSKKPGGSPDFGY